MFYRDILLLNESTNQCVATSSFPNYAYTEDKICKTEAQCTAQGGVVNNNTCVTCNCPDGYCDASGVCRAKSECTIGYVSNYECIAASNCSGYISDYLCFCCLYFIFAQV